MSLLALRTTPFQIAESYDSRRRHPSCWKNSSEPSPPGVVFNSDHNGLIPPLKKTRSQPPCGALIIAPCGEIRFTSAAAARYLKKYFGPRPDPNTLPAALAEWARTRPDIPFCLVKDGRFLSVRLLDRNRKRAMCVALEEHIIEEGLLNGREQLVQHWLREAKTNEEIGLILEMKTATVKKHVAPSSKNSASRTAPPPPYVPANFSAMATWLPVNQTEAPPA
jgi:DNA-binding CsgD family transcriptional regulator